MQGPVRLTVAEILAADSRDLGIGPWHVVSIPGLREEEADVILAGGVQPDPDSEFDRHFEPLMLLTVIPRLVDELLVVEGVSENVVEASWQALIDSISYGLLRGRKQT